MPTYLGAKRLLFLLAVTNCSLALSAENDAVAKLHDPDMDVRIEALRELQTTLDPRLPREMLRLLSDEGNSIRRLAARGVGSRYHQIPASEVDDYLSALRKLAAQREENEQVANMADRAIGLLTRDHLRGTVARARATVLG